MPTGYTANLYKGKDVSFPEFVMRCARTFGALVTMRDEPIDAPIPEEFKPSNYHIEQLEKARQRLAEVESWDDAEAEAEAEKAYREALRYRQDTLSRNAAIRQRYENMLARVKEWAPPTPDHRELKNFMIQQLESSIDFDCKYDPGEPQRLSGPEYKAQQIANAQRDIDYHTKEHAKEVERAKQRTDWIRALRGSLPVSSLR
jgi:hypothetical protein